MVVRVKLAEVRWIRSERLGRRPRRKKQRWLFAGITATSGIPGIRATRLVAPARPEAVKIARRIPQMNGARFVWIPE